MDGRSAPVLASTANTAPLSITVLGFFQATLNAQLVANFRSNKARALLAYLSLAGSAPVARTILTDLLWHGYTDNSARANLRQVVYNLRELFASLDLLEGDYRAIQLTVDPAVLWCDALLFDKLFESCQRHAHTALAQCPLCQSRLQQAAALYKGPFLADLGDIDSPPFQEWCATKRTHYAARYAEIQAALRPAVTTRSNLPQPLTSLIGRTAELSELLTKVLHPVYRCLTLLGPGGIGKTRLAIAVGEQMRTTFADGVWFVPLAGLEPGLQDERDRTYLGERIAMAISVALGLRLQGATHPTQQLTDYLREKTLLLILDNFEHLSTGVNLLVTLLQEAPQIRLLVTSRHRLAIQGQLVQRVAGLSLPPENDEEGLPPAQLIARYTSLQLFVERAENAALPLARDPLQLATIGALCRLVEGAPLGIELAVALLETQTPGEILQTVRSHYAALQAHWADLPPRQRSAQALLLTAWGLLSPAEAQLLARCSVFRGGFTLAAAQPIADATPTLLEALIHKSLLHEDGDRYILHELVRQFAAEQLALDNAVAQRTHTAHATYFSALLATWQPDDATIKRFRAAVLQDWENVQAAWSWAVDTGAIALLQQGVGGLAEFYNLVELFLEADVMLGRTITRLRQLLDASTTTAPTADRRAQQTLLAHLLWRHCYFVNEALAETARAEPLADELVTLGRALDDQALVARGYYELSVVAYFQGDAQRQEALLCQALPLAQQAGTIYDQIVCLNLLGTGRKQQGDVSTALAYYQQALALTQHGNYAYYDLMVLNNLGSLQVGMGHFATARSYFQQALPRAVAAGFKSTIAFIIASLGEIALLVGDYANARPQLVEAQQRYADLHDYALEPEILNMLAMLFAEIEDEATALAYCQQALASAGGHLYTVQQNALCLRGHLYRRQGQWDAAAAVYRQALTLSQGVHAVNDELVCQTYLAAVYLGQGDAAAALAALEPVLAQFASTSFAPQQRPQALLLMAHQILVANDDPRAQAVLHQAWTLVQEQADKIGDSALRTSFLSNVPVNRQLSTFI